MSASSAVRQGRRLFLLRAWPAAVLPLLLATPVAQAATPSLDFADALARAQAAAPVLRARSARVTAAREDAARAASLPDPQLVLGIDNLPVTGAHAFDSGPDPMTMKRIGLMQEFPARAKRQARQDVAERMLDRAEALSGVESLVLRERVADAWLAAWSAGRELDALRGLRDEAARAVAVAEARLRGGTGSAVDALAAKAAALEVDNRVDAGAARLAAARAALAGWLDVAPGSLPALGGAPDLATLPVPEARLLATTGRQRGLLDWHAREAVAEARLREALAERRPDWSVMAGYGQRDGRDDMLMLEFRVDLPLFPRNRQARAIAAGRAELDAAVAEREEAERAQLQAVRQALAQWHGLRSQVERHETRILPLARDRSGTALAAYRAGGALQPWLDARRDELQAHLDHARHLGELARLWAALAFLLPAEDAR